MMVKVRLIFSLAIFSILTLSGCDKSNDKILPYQDGTSGNSQSMKINLYRFDRDFNKVVNEFLKDELHNFSHGHKSLFSSYLNIRDATSKEIADAYSANQIDGDLNFYKKNIRITGRLASINSGIGNEPYLVFSDGGFNRPQAKLAEGLISEAAALKKNQQVTLVCIGAGSIMGSPMLSDCNFADHVGNFARGKIIREIEDFAKGDSASKVSVQIAVVSETIAKLIDDDMGCPDECMREMAKKVSFENSSEVRKSMASGGLKMGENFFKD